MDLFGDLPEPEENRNGGGEGDVRVAQPTPGQPSPGVGGKRKSEDGEPDQKTAQKPRPSVNYRLKAYSAERKGERDEMQDAHLIMEDFSKSLPHLDPSISRLALYAVFDGHAGARAARCACQTLHKHLRDKFPKGDISVVEKELKKSFVEAFKKTDEDFLKTASKNKPTWKDGTTAVMVLAVNDTLFIANLGDSKAMLCRYKEEQGRCVPMPLTADHNPSNYEERKRIEKAGGHVKDGRVMGVLEVSRSIGDGPYKNHGVTCLPDVRRCQLCDQDRYILIACDGLWKSFSMDRTIQFVEKILAEPVEMSDYKSKEDIQYDQVCHRLVSEAVLRLSGDNVTLILITINKS